MADGKVRLGILISGRGSNMMALIAAARAQDCPYEPVFVGASSPAAAGLALAQEQGVATWARDHRALGREDFDAQLDAALSEARVELIALAGYMRILTTGFIDRWAGRIVNIHPSLLPKYKGLHTHARAIAAGESEGGCSVHVVTPELDDGPVLAQARVPIRPGDTAEMLAERVLAEEHRLYPQALAEYARHLYPGAGRGPVSTA